MRPPTCWAAQATLLLLFCLTCAAQGPTELDAQALIAQRQAISNWQSFAEANSIQGWNDTEPCGWTGISCSATGSILSIVLMCENGQGYCAEPRAQGTVAPELQRLAALVGIWMHGQRLSGTLPDSWGSTGVFGNLKEIWLFDNNLTGTLPVSYATLGALPALQDLRLQNNRLSGPLPPEWGAENAFPELAYLWLQGNSLTGTIPASWGSDAAFVNLNSLRLTDNNLTGTIPRSWKESALPSLIEFQLDGNEGICGYVPMGFGDMVCTYGEFNCSIYQRNIKSCPLSASPAPSPSGSAVAGPSPAPVVTTTAGDSSSSVPIGAIVGAVLGAVAVTAAVLAFLTFRRSGWRERRAWKQQQKQPSILTEDVPPSSEFTKGYDLPLTPAKQLGMLLSKFGSGDSVTTKGDSAKNLPHSYTTTAAASVFSKHPAFSTSNVPASPRSLDSDPYLFMIQSKLPMSRLNAAREIMRRGQQRDSGSKASQPGSEGGAELSGGVMAWEVQWQNIQLVQQIGRGSYGRVFAALWYATPVAVKILIDDNADDTDLELPEATRQRLQEEAALMIQMRHPNVVNFLGLCIMPPCILTEFCSNGSLYDVLRIASQNAEQAAQLSWQRRIGMAFDAARGLLHLHQRGIIHRDVKSPNILVTAEWSCKVCDFNLSDMQSTLNSGEKSKGPANPLWLSPEVLEGNPASSESDVYSFGLVLFELLTWKLPWQGMQPYQVRRLVAAGERPCVPPLKDLPGSDTAKFAWLDGYCTLMRECWAQDPRKRPTFFEIVARIDIVVRQGTPLGLDPAGSDSGRLESPV